MSDTVTGILKKEKNNTTFLRSLENSLRKSPKDVYVSPGLIRKYKLVEGARVTGPVSVQGRQIKLEGVTEICGVSPLDYAKRTPFDRLVAIDPNERFNLGACGLPEMRIVDLVAPIGKGTRGLIVSPPKAGKTIMLKQIANAVNFERPDARVIVLLIDERPEEVTYFKREVNATVIASTIDQDSKQHLELSELMLANIRCELECGRDVVLLVDSLTRMGRSFNLSNSSRGGRTMSGGLDSKALQIPRQFFGLARNIEGGGSVTIVATCLVYTGSRMDQMIFEEFKGTGNSELVLDRNLSQLRLFPAIDIAASGTRKEEKLYSEADSHKIATMRKVLSSCSQKEMISQMLSLMRKFPTNEEFLANIPNSQ